jgi:hypothetical protein
LILAGEREYRAFCQRLEPIWGSFFTLFGISPLILAIKPQKKTKQTTICIPKKTQFVCFSNFY